MSSSNTLRKLVLLGMEESGKTAFCECLLEPKLKIESNTYNIDNYQLCTKIREKKEEMKEQYEESFGAILFVDASVKVETHRLNRIYETYQHHCPESKLVVLISKMDIANGLFVQEAINFAKRKHLSFWFISSKYHMVPELEEMFS